MSERSVGVLRVFSGGLVATAILAGPTPASAQVTYTVDRPVGAGRVTGTIVTNGTIGVLGAPDILSWSLAIDADGNGASVPLAGPPPVLPPPPGMPPPPPVGLGISGNALTATESGLFFDFSVAPPGMPAPSQIFQISNFPEGSRVWQLLSGMTGMTNELLREESNPLNQVIVERSGLVQIATTVIAPLEIIADSTLTADRRGPVVIAADDVTLDCAHHSVTGSATGIGIQASGRTGVTIARCVVNGFGEGIVLEDTSDSVLSENTLSENVNAGIRLIGSDRNRVTGNLVSYTRNSGHLATGLSLESSSNNKLDFNTVDHSDLAGITAGDGSHSNEFVANVSSFNGGAGFEVAGSANSFLRNTATRNGDFGFVLREEASRNKLIDNSACLNRPADATELRAGRRRNGNAWALNLFCSPAF